MATRAPILTVKSNPDLSALADTITALPIALYPAMKVSVEETLTQLKAKMIERSTQGPLYRRTGRLGRSWTAKPQGYNLRTYQVPVGSYTPYSVKHETGGSFTPVKAKFFWIPVGPNIKLKTRTAKVSPAQARALIAAGTWRYSSQKKARPAVPDGTKTKRTLVILNENSVPVYVLTPRIFLPKRLAFQGTSGPFVARTITDLHALSAQVVSRELAKIKH